jgi:LAO/AO transport system kinase
MGRMLFQQPARRMRSPGIALKRQKARNCLGHISRLKSYHPPCVTGFPLLALLMATEEMVSGRKDAEEVADLAAAVRRGNRVALARAITLVESRKAQHRVNARALLVLLNDAAGGSHRIGITGVPGVGKSTLIDRLGTQLTAQGHRVAVLAVDPSSSRSGGAILGDKTRMAGLAADMNAFIRPSPSSGTLGGVTRCTRETILLCEAASFDVVVVETVGVGQSEIAVAGMVDFFLLLMLAGGGDELQGIKKGIIELADVIAITKADGENAPVARSAAADYSAALHILTPPSAAWKPPVLTISARDGSGLVELWAEAERHRVALTATGEFQSKRRDQDVHWMRSMIEDQLRERFLANEATATKIADLEKEVRAGHMPPSVAADRAISLMLPRS